MISTERIIYCVNPGCNHPINSMGNRICISCQTPIVYRYIWATGSLVDQVKLGIKVANRYEVISRRVWLDTQPGLLPDILEELPKEVIPYLQLYQERLHLPQPYGFAHVLDEGGNDILLLENVPIDETGHIYPTIIEAWEQATAVRQVYWLWQILQLWKPLSELSVSQSLLMPNNLRVQGWCVRLLELEQTRDCVSLHKLGQCWQPWVMSAKASVAQSLRNIVQQMCETEVELEAIATQLNALLLSAAAELPLTLKVAGASDTGTVRSQNEDTCYPATTNELDDVLLPHLAIVCDGIGGHEGGEVASQLAVQSLKLQLRALLMEVATQTEVTPSALLQEQLIASLRVANNMICVRNNEQKRQGRERMATTLVMAVQIPQRVQTNNAHELYLANVGDSRAYWMTRHYCQLLTVDDDVVTREVRSGRNLYQKALLRPDANALTQALGIKDAESLRFLIQRFILEEDGLLLLCSDGLSDNNFIENYWPDLAIPVLTGQITVEDAVHEWIHLANQKNGHDNTSIVLTYCRVSPEYSVPVMTPLPSVEIPEVEPQTEPQIEEHITVENSPLLLDLDITEEPTPEPAVIKKPIKKPSRSKPLVTLTGILVLLIGGTGLGLLAWREFNPQGFQQMCRQLPQRMQQLCPHRH
ncbi:MAG: protein phosphatase 2C domain-containing protein [Desmonostoc vinosum HA7617-LM4]|jgi:protein phosphatase|nr:protein phosphatase 2C domain-containing protein [Desmonostoc vinosum HA7617-LM4]